MNANDIQRQNEQRFTLARELLLRADRLQTLLGLQAAALVIAAATLLVATGVLTALVGQDGSRVASALFLVLAALGLLAAAAGAGCALLRMHRGSPRGGRPAGLFFDLLGTAGAFATPAEFEPAFRSALNEEMTGYALAELRRAARAAARQRAALRWALRCLLLGFLFLTIALALALLGA